MFINLPILSQRDPRWNKILLGFNTNTYTIGSHGCLVTCLTAIANYFGANDTPDTVNSKLKAVKGFANGGFYRWGSIEQVFPMLDEVWKGRYPNVLSDGDIKLIKDSIDAGKPVMCEIDMSPATAVPDQHFVVFIAYNRRDENDFTIMDPWDGKIKSLKTYLSGTKPTARKTILQVIIYAWSIPTDNSGTEALRKQIEVLSAANKSLESEKEVFRDRITKSESEYNQKLTDFRNNVIKAVNSVSTQ